MVKIIISDQDARTLVSVLRSASHFYPMHAVRTRDQDVGRQIKRMEKKISNIIKTQQQ